MPTKLNYLGKKLAQWSIFIRRHRTKRKKEYEGQMTVLLQKDLDDATLIELSNIQLGLNLEANKEELYWSQCALVN